MFTKTFAYKLIDSPFGKLRLVASERGICALLPEASPIACDGEMVEQPENASLRRAEIQLNEYFAGKRTSFDLKLDMRGTVFQINAWRQLQKIPYGETISYGEQAKRLGDSKKARAVGMANNRNPMFIIVPCHRVVGADGSLVGFGGGLPMKQKLLEMEKAVATRQKKSA